MRKMAEFFRTIIIIEKFRVFMIFGASELLSLSNNEKKKNFIQKIEIKIDQNFLFIYFFDFSSSIKIFLKKLT